MKVLTPKRSYSSGIRKISSPRFSVFDRSPQTPTVSPKTKAWVSQLIDLPTPSKKLKNDKIITSDCPNNNIINTNNTNTQNKLLHLRRLLKKKVLLLIH